MDILYLLIPLSAVLILAIVAVFGWAVHAGQFDDLDDEGERLLDPALELHELHELVEVDERVTARD